MQQTDLSLINPVLKARQELRLSQGLLAKKLGVTEQTIRRAEQGTFNQLPPSVINLDKMLSDAGFPEYANVEYDYEEWRLKKRVALRVDVPGPKTLRAVSYTAGVQRTHPFSIFRMGIMDNVGAPNIDSVAGFAKLVAISPDSINEFERGTGVGILNGKHPEIANLLGDLGILRGDYHWLVRSNG